MAIAPIGAGSASQAQLLQQLLKTSSSTSAQPAGAASDIQKLMKALNETRRNNRIYVRLVTGTPGAVVKGEAMTALPPSVLSVMESDRNGGSFSPIRSATVGEWEVPMDSAISGSRLLTIDVDGGR